MYECMAFFSIITQFFLFSLSLMEIKGHVTDFRKSIHVPDFLSLPVLKDALVTIKKVLHDKSRKKTKKKNPSFSRIL